MNKESPIAFIYWFDENWEDLIKEELGNIEAFAFYRRVTNRNEFIAAVKEWFAEGNPQNLFIFAHGILSEERAYGLGQSGEEDEHITWEKLWPLVRVGSSSIALCLLGCRTIDIVEYAKEHMKGQRCDPYIVGMNSTIAANKGGRDLLRAFKSLLENLFLATEEKPQVYVDTELINLTNRFKHVSAYYPVTLNEGTFYADVRRFEEETGWTFREYLDGRKEPV